MRVTPFLLAAVVMSSTAAAADYTQTFGVGALEIFRVGISAQVAGTTDPSLAAKTDRTYLDGYNRVDSSGNLGEGAPGLPSRTSNFGFTSDQQVNLQQVVYDWDKAAQKAADRGRPDRARWIRSGRV